MTARGRPRFLVIDDFLPAPILSGLLDYAQSNQGAFHPSTVRYEVKSDRQVTPDSRLSFCCSEGLGPHEEGFTNEVHARLDHFFEALGVPPFEVAHTELELIAHGDGGFFEPHIDTFTQGGRANSESDRLLSAVFYFYREPRQFTGGELALYPFADGADTEVIEPLQNRLVIFPSFTPHEVLKIFCPSSEFADSRFSINCWLHRGRNSNLTGAAFKP